MNDFLLAPKILKLTPSHKTKVPKTETYVMLWPAEDESFTLPTRELK